MKVNYLENKEERNKKEWLKRKEKRRVDVMFRIMDNMVTRTLAAFKKGGVKPKIPILTMLGLNKMEFKEYLESKFKDGMTWENYGKKKTDWSIDHIISISQWDLNDIEEQKKACHYTNIQPLSFIENSIKK